MAQEVTATDDKRCPALGYDHARQRSSEPRVLSQNKSTNSTDIRAALCLDVRLVHQVKWHPITEGFIKQQQLCHVLTTHTFSMVKKWATCKNWSLPVI